MDRVAFSFASRYLQARSRCRSMESGARRDNSEHVTRTAYGALSDFLDVISQLHVAGPLPYPLRLCHMESHPHRSECHFPENAVAPVARFARAWTQAGSRSGQARL